MRVLGQNNYPCFPKLNNARKSLILGVGYKYLILQNSANTVFMHSITYNWTGNSHFF